MPVVDAEKLGTVLLVRLNRPEKLNAMTAETWVRLDAAWSMAEADEEIRVVVVTGNGKAFCSGADLGELIPLLTGARPPRNDYEQLVMDDPGVGQRAALLAGGLSKPVVAAINGDAIAGGCELVLGTDIRVIAAEARIGLQEARWGLCPLGGGTVRLAAQIPRSVAMHMLLTGDAISAHRACEVGLVSELVPRDGVLERALEIAERIAGNGPIAVRAIRRCVRDSAGLSDADALELEQRLGSPVLDTYDAREGPVAFLERRPPRFRGS
jgi:enoyl-CoA hydratase